MKREKPFFYIKSKSEKLRKTENFKYEAKNICRGYI